MQVIAQLSCSMTEAERSHWRRASDFVEEDVHSLETAMLLVVKQFERGRLYLEDSVEVGENDGQGASNQWQQLEMEVNVIDTIYSVLTL